MQSRGHRVTLLANEYFAPVAQKNGFDFAQTGSEGDYKRLLEDRNLWNPAKQHRVVAKKLLAPELGNQFKCVAERYEPGRTVVAAQTLAWGARVAQEKLGVPLASVHRQPTVLRSVYHSSRAPYMFLPDWLPRPLKRLQFWFLDKVFDHPFADAMDTLRREVGLPRVRR